MLMRWKSVVDKHTVGGSQPIEQCRDSDIDNDVVSGTFPGRLSGSRLDHSGMCLLRGQWALDTAYNWRWPAVSVWSLRSRFVLVTLHVVQRRWWHRHWMMPLWWHWRRVVYGGRELLTRWHVNKRGPSGGGFTGMGPGRHPCRTKEGIHAQSLYSSNTQCVNSCHSRSLSLLAIVL